MSRPFFAGALVAALIVILMSAIVRRKVEPRPDYYGFRLECRAAPATPWVQVLPALLPGQPAPTYYSIPTGTTLEALIPAWAFSCRASVKVDGPAFRPMEWKK